MAPVPRPLLERLLDKFTVGDGCWEWTGAHLKDGYGRIFVGGGGNNRRLISAHRAVYEWLVGPIPDGLQIDHLCRNPKCVRPDHLEPVTHRENQLRGYGWSGVHARKTHCPQGHAYDETNTYINPTKGYRQCRACIRERRERAKR